MRERRKQKTKKEKGNVVVRVCFVSLFFCLLVVVVECKEKILLLLLLSYVCNQGMRIMNHTSLLVLKFRFLCLVISETNRKNLGLFKHFIVCVLSV